MCEGVLAAGLQCAGGGQSDRPTQAEHPSCRTQPRIAPHLFRASSSSRPTSQKLVDHGRRKVSATHYKQPVLSNNSHACLTPFAMHAQAVQAVARGLHGAAFVTSHTRWSPVHTLTMAIPTTILTSTPISSRPPRGVEQVLVSHHRSSHRDCHFARSKAVAPTQYSRWRGCDERLSFEAPVE